ncbi:MAG: amidohydrolase family protein, partial [Erysipelotrichaceae bacterium]|nr:amidohydrolase family protein [Erysipelotrichaceae bacterium]
MDIIIKAKELIIDGHDRIENGYLGITDNKISAVSKNDLRIDHPNAHVIDVGDDYVLPGFIDTHIHGANNHDSIDGQQSSIDAISYNVIKDGCTAFLAS